MAVTELRVLLASNASLPEFKLHRHQDRNDAIFVYISAGFFRAMKIQFFATLKAHKDRRTGMANCFLAS